MIRACSQCRWNTQTRRTRWAALKKSWKYTGKNAISGGLGPSKKKCLQPFRIFLVLSQKFKHITKQLFWKYGEDRSRVAFRTTVGQTWTFRWEKESPASFCIGSHVFSLLFHKAQITLRQRQWWDLSNVASFVHFGFRNRKLLRAATLNACHLVTTTVGGDGVRVSQKKEK